MRRLFSTMTALVVLAGTYASFGCSGSSTHADIESGELAVETRSLTGNIAGPDAVVLSSSSFFRETAVACSGVAHVIALATDGTSATADVLDDCQFTLELFVGKYYVVSFIDDADGFVATLLSAFGSVFPISSGATAIDIGVVTIEGGAASFSGDYLAAVDIDDDGLVGAEDDTPCGSELCEEMLSCASLGYGDDDGDGLCNAWDGRIPTANDMLGFEDDADSDDGEEPLSDDMHLVTLNGERRDLLDTVVSPAPVRPSVEMTFVEEMDRDSVEAAFSMIDVEEEAVVGAFSWDETDAIATFTPSSNLRFATEYRVTVSAAARTQSNAAIGAMNGTFTTMTRCDVDGDGTPDIFIGADGTGEGGRAYLFSGASFLGNLSPVDADATISGDSESSNLGSRVACAGDVDGDGYADVLVSAFEADAKTGRVYLFSGSALVGGVSAEDAFATFSGEDANDWFGRGLAGVGDIDGDGCDDFLIGASNAAGGGLNRGRAYFFFGGPTLTGTRAALSADAVINGEVDENYLGYAVAGVGDVDGDGVDDIAVGAPYASDDEKLRGRVYLFSGTGLSGSMSPTDAFATITGSGENDKDYLARIARTGDVDGDGRYDVLVGAYYAASGGTRRGATYLFSGATLSGATATTDAIATVSGAVDYDWLGAVAGVGDVDGDGRNDVLVAATKADAGGAADADRGQACFFSGATFAGVFAMSDADAIVTGANDGDWLGGYISIDGVGDVNGDGWSDLLIGAYTADVGGTNRGQAYLFLGGPTFVGDALSPSDAFATVSGTADASFLGRSVAGAGVDFQ